MDNLIKYNKIYTVYFWIKPDKTVGVELNPYYSSRRLKSHPWIFYNTTRYDNTPYQRIKYACYLTQSYSNMAGSTLFVSKDSKLSRDLLRNSGYKITYSKNKADYVIVPVVSEEDFIEWDADIIIKNAFTNDVYLGTINNPCNYAIDPERYVESLANEILVHKSDLEYFILPGKLRFPVWGVKDIDEYTGILRGESALYISDMDIPIVPSNTLSVETLDMWRRLAASNDITLLEKSILNSDAKEYPFTLFQFMTLEPDVKYRIFGNGIRWLLKSLGLNTYGYFPDNIMIQPKDVNLLNDWIVYRLGLPATGGFLVNASNYKAYADLTRARLAVAPINVKEPITYSNYKNLVKM